MVTFDQALFGQRRQGAMHRLIGTAKLVCQFLNGRELRFCRQFTRHNPLTEMRGDLQMARRLTLDLKT